jgi:hypothetical protein
MSSGLTILDEEDLAILDDAARHLRLYLSRSDTLDELALVEASRIRAALDVIEKRAAERLERLTQCEKCGRALDAEGECRAGCSQVRP